MTDPLIGMYVRRGRIGRVDYLTLPHFVESIIDDEPVTRCGRRLRAIEGTELEYRVAFPSRTCAGCT